MDITITINTDNAAFEDDPGAEVARILRRLINELALSCEAGQSWNLRDVNGNKVGVCTVSADYTTTEIDTETADEWRNTPA